MVEHAHFGTTRYTRLSLSVIHVPGNPMPLSPTSCVAHSGLPRCSEPKNLIKPVYSTLIQHYQCKQSRKQGLVCFLNGKNRLYPPVSQGPRGHYRTGRDADRCGRL